MEREAQSLESELDQKGVDDKVESTPISTDHVLRVHGIYMSKRRHLEVRVDSGGRLILWDQEEGKLWAT
jgi:hypothetical protein